MRELDVLGVRVEMPSNAPMVLLKEVDGHRYLPIWIGSAEAAAIANALEGLVPPRPLTHDLMATLLADLGHSTQEVLITSLEGGTFYAELIVDGRAISARPSDAVALAIRMQVPIRCTDELLDMVGVDFSEEEDVEVEKFRAFLDTISAEDFDNPEEGS